jgi:hypothetical protein
LLVTLVYEIGDLNVTKTVDNNNLKTVLDKLDTVKIELLRLRAVLLPEEEAAEQEKKEIKTAKREIAKGSKVELQEFIKDLCC